MSIGDRIRDRRKEIGMTVSEMAERLGKHRATIYRYESNEIENMPVDVLKPIAVVLRTSPEYLMGWEEENPQGKEAENDLYSDITLRMMNDEEFAAAVECLYRMDQEQLQSFRKLFSR